ncbi:TPA: nucleotidyltransferase family protein [Bacillus tropicus]|nr:nucleotidyltransferase family protein [Bacillus tropicus]
MNQSLMNQLLRLAISSPGSSLDEIKTIDQSDIHELLSIAKEEKLFIQIYEQLQLHFEIPLEFQKRYKNYLYMRAENLNFLKELNEDLKGSIDYILFKGISVEAYYPKNIKRSFNDMDLISPDIDNFWSLASYFLKKNYLLNSTLNFYKKTNSSEIIGGARFESLPKDDYVREIEVQIGTFFMTLATQIPTNELQSYRSTFNIQGVDLPVLNRQGTLIILLAELITLDSARLRDLIDFVYLFQCDEKEFNIEEIASICKKYHLECALMYLKNGFSNQNVLSMPLLLKKLINLMSITSNTMTIKKNHVLPYLKEHNPNPYQSFLAYKLREWTLYLNDSDKLLPLLRQLDLRISAKFYFNKSLLVYFTPLNSFSHPWHWTRFENYDVVLTPIGSFAVSKHALQSDDELDYLDIKTQELIQSKT